MPVDVPAPRGPRDLPPARRPGSVRRTSTIDMTWPGGRGTQLRLDGRARDLLTPTAGGPVVVAGAEVHAGIAADRTIEELAVAPDRPGVAALVGCRGGGRLRGAIERSMPGLRTSGDPLYLLLDDISGASLIAVWAWSRHGDDIVERQRRDATSTAPASRQMIGICTGFAPGSTALAPNGTPIGLVHAVAVVPPLPDPADPWSWHALADLPAVAMRRARRIDVWLEAGDVRVDAMFRDHAPTPEGPQVAVHEYSVDVTIDRATMVVTRVVADPRVLPYPACPGAALEVHRLVGAPAPDLRDEVLDRLPGILGCTHLNDALRGLADVPALVEALEAAEA